LQQKLITLELSGADLYLFDKTNNRIDIFDRIYRSYRLITVVFGDIDFSCSRVIGESFNYLLAEGINLAAISVPVEKFRLSKEEAVEIRYTGAHIGHPMLEDVTTSKYVSVLLVDIVLNHHLSRQHNRD
jgi:hypothetical protein